MTTLKADRVGELDENARSFVTTFVEHVATIAGDDRNRMAIVARVHVLLFAALTGDDGASAWHMLHRAITTIVEDEHSARNARSAYAYLRSFVTENADLAHD